MQGVSSYLLWLAVEDKIRQRLHVKNVTRMNLNTYQKFRERIYTCIKMHQSELNIQYV